MAELISLNQAGPAQRELIAMLEEVLAQARAGNLVDLAIAKVERDDTGEPCMGITYYGKAQFGALLGSVSFLQHDMLANMGFYANHD